jgi:hypothetical protein
VSEYDAPVSEYEEPEYDDPDREADAGDEAGVGAGSADAVSAGANDDLRSLMVAGVASSAKGTEAALEGRAFAWPIVSAGSGTVVLTSESAVSAAAAPATAAESALDPLDPLDRCVVPESENPVPVRDGAMKSLSTTASVASPSGSASRLGGVMMSGG